MKSLDDQVPSGYFDALPNQTLARLEAGMQSTPGTSEQARAAAVPIASSAPPAKRDEDSGLHDIRNLAQSTKQRISRRASTPPPDDVLAQTSGGWKAIALPEPAKMVSLPSLDELPSKKEVLAKERAAAAPAVETPAGEHKPFSLPSARKKSRAGLYIVGTLVAAAAGVVIFFQMNKEQDTKQANVAMNSAAAPAAPATATPAAAPVQVKEAPKVEPIPQPEPADPHAEGAGSAVGGDVDGTPPPPETKAETKVVVPTKGSRGKKTTTKTTTTIDKSVSKPDETKTPPVDNKKVDAKKGSGSASGSAEPSFDDLLKQAGVDDKKKTDKPKLEKKELTQDDFKSRMNGVNVTKCYKGNQGTATVKLTVGPTGQVTKASVGGQFAGTPEGACVEAAVKGATFPAWDGGPQTFNYSYMLSD